MPEPSARAIYQTPWLSARSPCRWEATSASEMCRSICLKISLLFRIPGNFPFTLACCWVWFILSKAEHLLGVRWRRGLKYSKRTMRLWLSEKWNAQLLWKESDLNTLFFLSKLPPRNRNHLFSLPLSEIWLMFIQFKLNLGKSVASAVYFFFDVLLMLLLFSGPADWAAREGWTNTYLSGYRSSSVLLMEQTEITMCLWSSSSPSCTVPAEIHLHPCTRFCPRQWNCQRGLLRRSVQSIGV